MSLLELGPVAFGGTPGIITFLQGKHVLASQKKCPCGTMMVLQSRQDISDGCRWRCPDCHKCIRIRKGSVHWWARQYPVTDAKEEIGVTEATAIQVYSWLRDVCSYRLCNLDPEIKLGGPGKIVSYRSMNRYFHTNQRYN